MQESLRSRTVMPFRILSVFFVVSCSSNQGEGGSGKVETPTPQPSQTATTSTIIPTTTPTTTQAAILVEASAIPAVAAGTRHVCMISESGGVNCRGMNDRFQLGQEGPTSETWKEVPGVSDIRSLVSSVTGTCALSAAGVVKCWGEAYLTDAAGSIYLKTPTTAQGIESDVVEVVRGQTHFCARKKSGKVLCWGSNTAGQVGVVSSAATVNLSIPTEVTELGEGATSLVAGRTSTCALKSDKTVHCWGLFDNGIASMPNGRVTQMPGLSNVVSIAMGEFHVCAVDTVGAAWCWGQNVFRQLGTNPVNLVEVAPVRVAGLTAQVSAVAAAGTWSCFLVNEQGWKCVGSNVLGLTAATAGVPSLNTEPNLIPSFLWDVKQVRMGYRNICGITASLQNLCLGSYPNNQFLSSDLSDKMPIHWQQ